MKLILVFAFLAFVCMARSAPTRSSTSRTLILPDYHDNNEAGHDEETHIDVDEEGEEDDDDDETTTTTTTTTRRTTIYVFPTRNRNLIPSRRPPPNQRTTSISTTTMALDDDEQDGTTNEYDGDFKYIRDFRKYFKQILDDIKKAIRKLTGYDFDSSTQHYNRDEE